MTTIERRTWEAEQHSDYEASWRNVAEVIADALHFSEQAFSSVCISLLVTRNPARILGVAYN